MTVNAYWGFWASQRQQEKSSSANASPILPDIGEREINWSIQLAKKFRDELGAVHLGVIPSIVEQDKGLLKLGTLDGDLAGFILTRHELANDARVMPIIASAVPHDLQKLHVGTAMLKHVEAAAYVRGQYITQAIARHDLPCNIFWFNAGFVPCFARTTAAVRGKPAIVWRKFNEWKAGERGFAANDLSNRVEPTRPRGGGGRFLTAEQIAKGAAEVYAADHDKLAALLAKSPLTHEQQTEALARHAIHLHR